MAVVTICSDFGAQENKMCHFFHFSPIYLPWSDGTRCRDLIFFECWVSGQVFHSPLSASSRGSSFPLCFLTLEWYYLHIWGCWYFSLQSSPAFHMMYSAHKLNKKGDNTFTFHTPFPILNLLVIPCKVLTVVSWYTYRFLRIQVRWSAIPISLRIFHSLLWPTQSKV